jgi:hypothetical protein
MLAFSKAELWFLAEQNEYKLVYNKKSEPQIAKSIWSVNKILIEGSILALWLQYEA